MATSRPRDARLKERSSSASSASHHTDTLHGRRTTRPSIPGSSDRDAIRKPMVSSSTTTISRSRSQTSSSAAIGKRVPVRSSIEKPPSPSGAPRRVPTPNTLKERTAKSSSSLPRAAISSKPASGKASKPLKSTRTQPLVRAKSLGASAKELTVTTTPNTTEPPPATKSEQEEEILIQVVESEQVDVTAIKDDVPNELDLTSSFAPDIPEDTTDSTSQTDQQETSSPKRESEIAAANDEGVGGDGKRVDGDEEIPEEPEENPVMESSEDPQSEPAVDSGKLEESEKEKATWVESSETKRSEVVAFRKPEAAATRRKFVKDGPRSNEVIEEARTKLMEKRKSKVLALVGAFETVISLQEPEGQTGQSQGRSGEEGDEEVSNETRESTE